MEKPKQTICCQTGVCFRLYHCSTAMPFTASQQSSTNTASSPFADTNILLQLDTTLPSKHTLYKNFHSPKQTSR